ncbi:MAG TPA: hypothetical protein ENN35_03845 [Deltaproteobacteria bacterium]|jgi:vacuolar-type H+-ATPase subunit H|nr:MAG: hypothetical protein AVO39_09945 [delta proteobacterium MLS_D]HET57559.1 hypothetical protein [Deltaproteobacteria bacterium]
MDSMVSRIVEIEKASSGELEQAEKESKKAVEEHRRNLEEEKRKHIAEIDAEAGQLRQRAVEEAEESRQKEYEKERAAIETFMRDPAIHEEIEELVLSLLLSK